MSELDLFRKAVVEGLSARPKQLPSRYFYDTAGDRLFGQIMKSPAYYLTRSERENMPAVARGIADWLGSDSLDLIDLGSGDGVKTEILIEHLIQSNQAMRYFPVDISPGVIVEQKKRLEQGWPALEIQPIAADYIRDSWVLPQAADKRLFLFLGSNLGNFDQDGEQLLFAMLRRLCRTGDGLLIGLDLAKEPARILAAYNDPEGITARFNLNILERINRELGGNFDLSSFVHYPVYDPLKQEARSHLVCTRRAEFGLSSGEQFSFEAWEAIHTETSRKYQLEKLKSKALSAGFETQKSFVYKEDQSEVFADLLWVRNETRID